MRIIERKEKKVETGFALCWQRIKKEEARAAEEEEEEEEERAGGAGGAGGKEERKERMCVEEIFAPLTRKRSFLFFSFLSCFPRDKRAPALYSYNARCAHPHHTRTVEHQRQQRE